MKHHERRPDHNHLARPASRRGSEVAPGIAPGKRTLTMGLVPRAGAGAAPLLPKLLHDPGAAAAPAESEPAEDWMRVALRPDLHQTPIMRKSLHEIGYAGGDDIEHDMAGAIQADLDDGVARGPALRPSGSGGSPLPAAVQAKMESSFDADFSDVRVHQGDEASAIGARAFAQGNHIHFAQGQYDPGSQSGQALLGHELAHVVQQRAGIVQGSQGKGLSVNVDPGLEAEADRAGEQAAQGEPARVAGAERGRQARSPSGDTLQGDFLDVLLSLPVLFGIAALLLAIGYQARSYRLDQAKKQKQKDEQDRQAREQKEAEERQAEEQAKLLGAQQDAGQMAEAAAQAAQIAQQAAQESALAEADAGTAVQHQTLASNVAGEALEAEDSRAAAELAQAARTHAVQAVAAATQAVAQAAQGYADKAAESARQTSLQLERATDGASGASQPAEAAKAAAQLAIAEAGKIAALAKSGNVEEAIAALKSAIGYAMEAATQAARAERHASDAEEAASAASTHADEATSASTQFDQSRAVSDLTKAKEPFSALDQGSVTKAGEAIEQARAEASGHQKGARIDAQQTRDAAEKARATSDGASTETRGATAGVFEIVEEQIKRQGSSVGSAVGTIEQLLKSSGGATEIAEALEAAKHQRTRIATLHEELQRARESGALPLLQKLLTDALDAGARARAAQKAAQAVPLRNEARQVASEAEKLAQAASAQATQVGESREAAEAALRKADEALTDARTALAEAEKMHTGALAAASIVSMSSPDAAQAATQAMQMFAKVEQLVARARECLDLARQKAEEAGKLATKTQQGAAKNSEPSRMPEHQKRVDALAKKAEVDAEVENVRSSAKQEASARQAMNADADRAKRIAETVKQTTRDAQLERTRATGLTDTQKQALAHNLQRLAAEGEEHMRPAEHAVKELSMQSLQRENDISGAQIRLGQTKEKSGTATQGPTGAEALEEARTALASFQKELSAPRKTCYEARELLAGVTSLSDLADAVTRLSEVKRRADDVLAQSSSIEMLHGEVVKLLGEVNDYIKTHTPAKEHSVAERDLSGFAVADTAWAPTGRQRQVYQGVWQQLSDSQRVLDPGNLVARQAVPDDQSKYFSTLMELQYLLDAVTSSGAYVQVGRMSFATLKAALTAAGLTAHADQFTEQQGTEDAALFGISVSKLCYEADGVIWHPDRVEVVQHKQSISREPLKNNKSSGVSRKPFEEQLSGASNQLGGWTAEGGRSALGGQPEYAPPGANRTRMINIALPFADAPDQDYTEYEQIMQEVMSANAANGSGPPRHTLVEQIRVTWGREPSQTVKLFTHQGNGVYKAS